MAGQNLTRNDRKPRLARLTTRLLGTIACALVLNACSTVPGGGPTRQSVIDVGTHAGAPYLLVPISDYVLHQLLRFPGPSLFGRFGDYRGPVEQRIGVGDTVQVTVFEAAGGGLFSQTIVGANSPGSHSAVIPAQVVANDGSITVPYAGRVRVVGQTPPQVEQTIVERLTGKAIEPQAIVTLSKNVSTSVTVTGEVVQGGRIPLTARGDRILDVIATSGGLKFPVHETFIELSRAGKTVRVPMQALLADPRENIYARPGDTLTVVRYPLSFTAVGATLRNAVVPFEAKGISLEEAIGHSAGLVDERADPEGVFVMRYEPNAVARTFPGITPEQAAMPLVPVVYLINMREPASLFLARRFAVHDKDILYVSNSPFSDLQKVFGLVGTLTSPAIQGVSTASYIK
jgi:polysaccharide export outer membrane protein